MAQACIYGVDLNPLAVELAKLSLWLATVSKDKPLSFLDHHLRCGNSLIGARVADLPLGLAPAEQVAKERKAAYKAQKRPAEGGSRAAAGQITMLDDSAFAGAMHIASGMMRLIEDLGSDTLADVHRAEEVYRDSVRAVTERRGCWATSGLRGTSAWRWTRRFGAGCRATCCTAASRCPPTGPSSTRRAPSQTSGASSIGSWSSRRCSLTNMDG